MAKKVIDLDGLKVKTNDQSFVQNQYIHNSLEDYGWDEEFLDNMLYVAEECPKHEWMKDPEILNNLGIVFTEGVCVDIDMERGIGYFEKAIQKDDDLARINLADIYREGKNGIPQDYRRAYKLYRQCGLPYAHFRVGEAFELGLGVDVELPQAKRFYRLAYSEGYPMAIEKLKTFNFLED